MGDEMYEVTERLGITEDGRAVPEESVESRWLYAVPGQFISMEEARRVGLVTSLFDSDEELLASLDEDDETTVSLTEEGEAVVAKEASVVDGGLTQEGDEPTVSVVEDDERSLDFPPETKRSRKSKRA